jgi:hydroxylamine reductase
MSMFCYQCQETLHNQACDKVGVCGKSPEIAALQDLLVWALKGMSFWGVRARRLGVENPAADQFIAEALFATITNVNFDEANLERLINRALELRDDLRQRGQAACQKQHGTSCDEANLPDVAKWQPENGSRDEFIRKGVAVGILGDLGVAEDIRSLRELLIYGVKGLAAYAHHAYELDFTDDSLLVFLQDALDLTVTPNAGAEDLIGMTLKCGETAVTAMALLDKANTETFGHPEPTVVNLGVEAGPAILISGHDLRDLLDLLEQTKDTGVKVYTHGEMLPAHAYPVFKQYDNLVGNYGGAWWQQQDEFERFNGPIVMTTNCLVPIKDSYSDRLFTTGPVAWPEIPHIAPRQDGKAKDFSAVIAKAQTCGSPEEIETGTVTIGFAHETVLGVADKVVEAIQAGAIKRFVVMAGCDGRHQDRSYYTELAQQLPQDHVILTAGCAKYRYNKLELGDIGGIPRVLDAGQCNDSYSLVVVALKLAEVFGMDDVNELPISYDIAWYEQKAVTVLLALLHLGVKNIRLGPSLPAFVSPGVLNVLVENFNIMPIDTVENDLSAIIEGV